MKKFIVGLLLSVAATLAGATSTVGEVLSVRDVQLVDGGTKTQGHRIVLQTASDQVATVYTPATENVVFEKGQMVRAVVTDTESSVVPLSRWEAVKHAVESFGIGRVLLIILMIAVVIILFSMPWTLGKMAIEHWSDKDVADTVAKKRLNGVAFSCLLIASIIWPFASWLIPAILILVPYLVSAAICIQENRHSPATSTPAQDGDQPAPPTTSLN